MDKPLFEEGHETIECPRCHSSILKYRYAFNPENKSLAHWLDCDFPTCHKQFNLKYMDGVPEDLMDLLEERELGNLERTDYEVRIRRETAEEIAKNFIDTLAVRFIAERTGVSLEKVQQFRNEYEQSHFKK